MDGVEYTAGLEPRFFLYCAFGGRFFDDSYGLVICPTNFVVGAVLAVALTFSDGALIVPTRMVPCGHNIVYEKAMRGVGTARPPGAVGLRALLNISFSTLYFAYYKCNNYWRAKLNNSMFYRHSQ